MTKLEMIRDELREKISMDAQDIYMDFKTAENKKEMVQILLDQNLKLSREEMLDVLEDLGFHVGNMRRKPMDPAAKEKWHRDHPNNGGRKKAPETKNFNEFFEDLEEIADKIPASAPAPNVHKIIITQEMLDTANAVKAIRDEIETLTAKLKGMLDLCEERGWVIE